MKEITDQEILALYSMRDQRAVMETQRKYGAYCYTVAQRVLQCPQDAEECVNDTYLAAWQNIPPEKPANLRLYLAGVVRNIAIDRYRRRARARHGGGEYCLSLDELAECLPDQASDTVADYMAEELRQAINRFLHTLPARECNLFLGRYYFLYPISEMAERFGISEGYVYTVLSRTRQKLKVFLKEEHFI